MLIQSERGISTIELIPVLLVFALLFNFSLGFFGVIHSGIMNSIAARNYAFETFRNRPNLVYFRDSASSDFMKAIYSKDNYRFHGVLSETASVDDWIVTTRPIKFTDLKEGVDATGDQNAHNQLVRQITDPGKVSDIFTGRTPDDGNSGVSPVWIQTLYGMCLTADCKKAN